MIRFLISATFTFFVCASTPATAYVTKLEELLSFSKEGSAQSEKLIAELFVLAYADGFVDGLKMADMVEQAPNFCIPDVQKQVLANDVLQWISHDDQKWLQGQNLSAGFSVITALTTLYACSD